MLSTFLVAVVILIIIIVIYRLYYNPKFVYGYLSLETVKEIMTKKIGGNIATKSQVERANLWGFEDGPGMLLDNTNGYLPSICKFGSDGKMTCETIIDDKIIPGLIYIYGPMPTSDIELCGGFTRML